MHKSTMTTKQREMLIDSLAIEVDENGNISRAGSQVLLELSKLTDPELYERWLMLTECEYETSHKPTEVPKPTVGDVNDKLFSDVRIKKFESIKLVWESWVSNPIGPSPLDRLSSSEYIDYHIWETQTNSQPSMLDHVIFHGGCLRCESQQIHGIDRCTGCRYFRANWTKEDLRINK